MSKTDIITKQQAVLGQLNSLGLTLYDTSINDVTVFPALVLEPVETELHNTNAGATSVNTHRYNLVVVDAADNHDTLKAARKYVAEKLEAAFAIRLKAEGDMRHAEALINEVPVTLAGARVTA
ncbi:MAG: hypothetical protein K8R90_05190 [Candidatus Cloacimonetes bacterium]|nr:hypothetical protein [Candidatus Cloacimonadota bacterium]